MEHMPVLATGKTSGGRMKTLAFIHRNDTRFAVGDFSPVLTVFSHHELGNTVSPFLLLDHLGPGRLLPTSQRKGVNEHPHRGFETVTLVYAGEIEHRDSTGGGGVIKAGDVQWMTAASGVIHRELFSEDFSRTGGPFELLQLWVNLPAKDKMSPARYQNLTKTQIPVVELPDGAGTVRVVAGAFFGIAGPALTHTRMNVLDAQIVAGQTVTFPAEEGDTALVFVRTGEVRFAGGEVVDGQGMAVMSSHGGAFDVTVQTDSKLVILTGAPLNEAINAHGFFVMNTYEEILQTYEDLKQGKLGGKVQS